MELKEKDEDVHQISKRISRIANELGTICSNSIDILRKMVPEILHSNCRYLEDFGAGIVERASNLKDVWFSFEEEMIKTGPLNCDYRVMIGALKQLEIQDSLALSRFLTYVFSHDDLSKIFPVLQCNVVIDDIGVSRLNRAILRNKAPTACYRFLPSAVFLKDHDQSKFCAIVKSLFETTADVTDCIELYYWKLNTIKKIEVLVPVKDLGWYLLHELKFDSYTDREANDFHLAEIIKLISDLNYDQNISDLCSNLIDAIRNHRTGIVGNINVLKAIANTSPEIFLDYFVKPSSNKDLFCLADNFNNRDNPLSEINDDVIFSWCSRHFAFENVAYHIEAFLKDDQITGWNPIIFRLLEGTSDPIELLVNLRHHFYPGTYSGNSTDRMEDILKLLPQLKRLENDAIQHWVDNEMSDYKDAIRKAKEWQAAIAEQSYDL